VNEPDLLVDVDTKPRWLREQFPWTGRRRTDLKGSSCTRVATLCDELAPAICECAR
jgi:hypothetical protein